MRYKVLVAFRIKFSKGELELQPGQIITMPFEKAIDLLLAHKITPAKCQACDRISWCMLTPFQRTLCEVV